MDIEINGKRVVIRDKIEARYFDTLLRLVDALTDTKRPKLASLPVNLSFDEVVSLGQLAIESWEFDGEINDPESWARLDMPSEFMPLLIEMGQWLGAKFNPPKNS